MLVFLGEFFIIGFLWMLASCTNDKTAKRFLKILAYSSILFLTCFRSISIDPDTPMYVNYFGTINKLKWSNVFEFRSFEVGDVFLFKLIGSIWNDERFFIIVMACITTIPFFVFIETKSKNIYLSLLVFLAMDFWFGSIFLMRQYTAMAFCFAAYAFAEKNGVKSLLFFYLFVFIAYLFHQSAVFFAPVYLLRFLKKDCPVFCGFIVLLSISLVLGKQIVSALNNLSRIQYEVSHTGGLPLLIFLLLIAFGIPLLCHAFIKEDKTNRLLYLMFLYTIIIQALALFMGNMTRAAKYTMASTVVLIPNFLDYYCKQKQHVNEKAVVSFASFAFFGLFFLVSLINNNNSITQYSFMWQL